MDAPPPRPAFIDRPLALIPLGAFLLLIPALLNGFPFVFPDSTDYLTIAPQVFRLPFYGLFILFFHLNHFIWAPIIVQCLIVSHLLWLMLQFTSGIPAAKYFLPLMLALTLFTSLPCFTGFLMADIFTPIMFLTFYLLAFHHPALSAWQRYYLFLLACVATVSQIANLPLGIGLGLVLLALLTLTHASRRQRRLALAYLGLPILLSFIAALLCNGLVFHQWKLAPAGKTFLMANMIEYGPARHYLETSCPTQHYRICKFIPLPKTANELMWIEGSVVWHLGGFIAMEPESTAIVRGTLATYPDEVARMVRDNFLAGLRVHTPGEEFQTYFIIEPFRALVRNKFGDATLAALNASAEAQGRIPHSTLRAIDDVVTPGAFFLLILIALATVRSRPPAFTLAVSTVGFILGDVLFCSAMSGVYDRYQSRVTWLMPLMLGLLLIDYWKKRRANAGR